ncbi:MAG: hypothetical protein ABTR54_01890, partial [Candidatus Competibacter sp.]
MRTQGNFTLELERVFVELRIAPAAGSISGRINLLADVELQGSKPIWAPRKTGHEAGKMGKAR